MARSISRTTIAAVAAAATTKLLLISFAIQQCQAAGQSREKLPNSEQQLVNDELHYINPSITSGQLLRARGYLAEEFKLTTRDRYILSIVRGTNPLIDKQQGQSGANANSKYPIVFLHGSRQSSKSYLVNSEGVRPRTYNSTTSTDLSKLSLDQLLELVDDDPAAYSLPFLAMNFGYEVWLVDRRGFGKSRGLANRPNRTLADAWTSVPASLFATSLLGGSGGGGGSGGVLSGHTLATLVARFLLPVAPPQPPQPPPPYQKNSLGTFWQQVLALGTVQSSLVVSPARVERDFIDTFDPDYWQFGLDEQAEIDFPAVIDFVLNKTGKPKVHTVGLSCGGAIIVLGLAAQPELATKISRAVLWAPAVNMKFKPDLGYQANFAVPFMQSFSGPIPFLFQTEQLLAAVQALCGTELAQETFCESFVGSVAGFSGGQQPARPWFLSDILQGTSSSETVQLGQFGLSNATCKLNFQTAAKNQAKYNQAAPPCYDLGQIRLTNMSLYVGNNDRLVSPSDVETTVSKLSVPAELHRIGDNGVHFNHLGFINHKQANKLAILPSLLDIERSQAQERARVEA